MFSGARLNIGTIEKHVKTLNPTAKSTFSHQHVIEDASDYEDCHQESSRSGNSRRKSIVGPGMAELQGYLREDDEGNSLKPNKESAH